MSTRLFGRFQIFSPPKIASNTSIELAKVGSSNLTTSNSVPETSLLPEAVFIKIKVEKLGMTYEKWIAKSENHWKTKRVWMNSPEKFARTK